METLKIGEKKDWATSLDPQLMRTGCKNLWDAVFMCFANYRNLSEEEQLRMIEEKGVIIKSSEKNVKDWVEKFRFLLYETSKNQDDPDNKLFFTLLSLRFLELELFPFLHESIPEDISKKSFQQEIEEKVLLLAEYRLKKKAKEFNLSDVEESIHIILEKIFTQLWEDPLPEGDLNNVSKNLGVHILCISSDQTILFDSFEKNTEIFQENIVVLVHENSFDSVGRCTTTRNGHKKLSRLFGYEDPFIVALRKSHLNNEDL